MKIQKKEKNKRGGRERDRETARERDRERKRLVVGGLTRVRED